MAAPNLFRNNDLSFQRRSGSAPTDLDEWFTGSEQRLNVRPCIPQHPAKKRVAGIPTCQPNDLRRRPESGDEIGEVGVFGKHHSTFTARPSEDRGIFGVSQAQFANRDRVDPEFFAKPSSEPG